MRIHTELPVSSGGRAAPRLNYMRSSAVNHTSPRQPAFTQSPRQHQWGPIPSTDDRAQNTTLSFSVDLAKLFFDNRAAMVKLGSNLSDKLEKQPSADDGFDNIPLITPLEVNQLQQPFADKITGLILITLAFLTSLLLLLMYKAMWYDQLTCPEGFILKMYYTEQQQQGVPGIHDGANTGLYAALSHLNHVKRTGSELPSPWLPVISALKEAEVAKQGNEPLPGGLEGE
ncbi:hypothetical protein FQN60_012194, partial [Etheostoma spectabile]